VYVLHSTYTAFRLSQKILATPEYFIPFKKDYLDFSLLHFYLHLQDVGNRVTLWTILSPLCPHYVPIHLLMQYNALLGMP
jgi:hypothetical protein